MNNTNYIGGIVKILETPILKSVNNSSQYAKCRVQLSSVRQNHVVNLVFWSDLAYDILNYYKINDYILIEGFISLCNPLSLKSNIKTSKRVEITITVLRVYPFLFEYNHLNKRLLDIIFL